jgi:hypothetical protein
MTDQETNGFSSEGRWMAYYGDELRRHYGIGAVVAIFEEAVVDFGETAEDVRDRVESELGESVFVAAVPETSPEVTLREMPNTGSAYRRRVLFTVQQWYAGGEFLGGRELLQGVVYSDGQERRYANFEYRLLLKHGVVSSETVLVGGILFWKKGQEPHD